MKELFEVDIHTIGCMSLRVAGVWDPGRAAPKCHDPDQNSYSDDGDPPDVRLTSMRVVVTILGSGVELISPEMHAKAKQALEDDESFRERVYTALEEFGLDNT